MGVLKRLIAVSSIVASIIIIIMSFAIFTSGQPFWGIIFLVFGLAFVNVATRTINYIIFGKFSSIHMDDED